MLTFIRRCLTAFQLAGFAGSFLFVPFAQAAATSLEDQIEQDFLKGNLEGLHTSLVWHQGNIIAANHFAGEDQIWGRPLGKVEHAANTLHDLRSVTKSIVGLLYGIALDEGKVPALDESLVKQFSEYPKLAADNERLPITIHHTLSMQMGMAWNEDLPYSDPRNSEIMMENAQDRYRFVLNRPVIEKPGSAGCMAAFNGHYCALN